MKFLLLIIITLNIFIANAQSVSGIIVSDKTKIPIARANVYFSHPSRDAYTGTFSDENGYFEIGYSKDLEDTLTISCLGYATLKIKPDLLKSDTIFLKEAHVLLSDIIVKAQSAKEFLMECINGIPGNYKDAMFRNVGFGWQILKMNDTYEKLIQSYITIEQQYLENGIKTTVNYDSIIESPTDSLNDKIITQYRKLDSNLYFDLIRTGPSILNIENIDGWDYNYSYNDEVTLKGIVVIEGKSKGKFNDYKFYINESDYAIVKIEYCYNWNKKPSHIPIFPSNDYSLKSNEDSLRFLITDIKGIIQYERTNTKYNLKYLSNEIKYKRVINSTNWALPIKWDECILLSEIIISDSQEYQLKDDTFYADRQNIRKDFRRAAVNNEFEKALTFLKKDR